MIPDDLILEIRNRVGIVEIVGAYIPLKRSGKTYRGPCPLHGGEKPNFSVDPVRGGFKCFVCGESGDVFAFFMKHLGMTYPEAIRHAASFVGITIPDEGSQKSSTKEEPVAGYEQAELKQLEKAYSDFLETHRQEVLSRASAIRGRSLNVHSFHGIIGSQYRSYADVVHAEFSDPQDFVARWLEGLRRAAEEERREELATYGRVYGNRRANRLVELLRDDTIWEYTRNFHERNFFRYLHERIRAKPQESLWSVWFGNNQMTWGVLIAPSLRGGEWKNDVSEIRRSKYMYWTVGHVLAEGFVNPDENTPHSFVDTAAVVQFYRNILKRISVSQYERAVVDHYCAYLESSSDPESEPLLIPEMRYAGLERKHEYRLDFAVLNSHVMGFTGFELSPHSTHLAVTGIAKRTQIDVNNEIRENWEREIAKRQNYFDTFGIRVETFTDAHLVDMANCFQRIKLYLSARPIEAVTVENELQKLRNLTVV
jgi:hypothetical protein